MGEEEVVRGKSGDEGQGGELFAWPGIWGSADPSCGRRAFYDGYLTNTPVTSKILIPGESMVGGGRWKQLPLPLPV